MSSSLSSLEPFLQPAARLLVAIAGQAGLLPLVTSARRTRAQQVTLYNRYLAGQSRFPAAPPGQSTHEYGLAFDLHISDESQLADLGRVWEAMGGLWGGPAGDPIHFEAGGAQAYVASHAAPPQDTMGLARRILDWVAGVGLGRYVSFPEAVAVTTLKHTFPSAYASVYASVENVLGYDATKIVFSALTYF